MGSELTKPAQSLKALLARSSPKLADWEPTSDAAIPYLTHGEATSALACLEPWCGAAEFAALMEAFARLAPVTTGRTMDRDTLVVSSRLLSKVMQEFPAEIAFETIAEWPQTAHGAHWPTEHDLREQAQARAAPYWRLRADLRGQADRDPPKQRRTRTPVGKTAEFVERVKRHIDEDYVRGWLTGRFCDFTDDTIFMNSFGRSRVERDVGHIARDCGVHLAFCADVTARMNAELNALYGTIAERRSK